MKKFAPHYAVGSTYCLRARVEKRVRPFKTLLLILTILSSFFILVARGTSPQQSLAEITTANLFKFSLPEDDPSTQIKAQLIKFNPTIYELAYTTYLQSNNIKDAYTVAAAAVQQNQHSQIWRERLAQVAVWNYQPFVALQQNIYLTHHFHSQEALANGKKLAESLHDDDHLIEFINMELLRGNNSEKIWQEYIDTMLRIGDIQQLMQRLEKNKNKLPLPFYLLNLAHIYQIKNNPQAQLKVLSQYAATIGMTPTIAEQMAVIYLNQRDIQQAYNVMHRARDHAATIDQNFWNAYALVAYLMNNSQEQVYAYQKLLQQNHADLPVFTQLVDLTFSNDPKLSYQYAMAGRALYPNSYPLNQSAFALLISVNKIEDFPTLLATTPPSVKKMLNYDNGFWNAQANYWLYQNNPYGVVRSYLQGITFSPNDTHIKSDFISMLIEMGDLIHLKQALQLWQSNVLSQPNLWGVYAQGHARLNNMLMSKLILNLFYEQFDQYKLNSYWLIALKDNLENSFLPKQSAAVAHYVWPIYLNVLRQQSTPPDYTQLIDYTKLSMSEASGDPTAIALIKLQDYVNKDVALLMLTWALEHQNFSLAYEMYLFYQSQHINPPSWVTLRLALHRNDRTLMRKVLTSKKPIVSYKDKIKAAQQIDAIPLAQTAAYDALKRNRHDHDLYDNFYTPIMMSTADRINVSQDYYQFGSIIGPRTNMAWTYFLMPSISLTPYNSLWLTKGVSNHKTSTPGEPISASANLVLATVPSHDERAGIKINTTQQRGKLNVDLGYRSNLTSFYTAKITRTYKLLHDLDTTASVGYHQPADDTVSLLVGATENNIKLDFIKTYTLKDSVSGTFLQKFFYTQNGQYLADGSQLTIHFDHKFWLTYPDFTLSPYGVVSYYYNKTREPITGSVTKIIPRTVLPTVNFFIPLNFTEYGITGSFGQSHIDEYNHRWDPFGSLTISKNSVVGLGELFNIGMAGPVFGRDHLLFYYEWGSNQGQGLQNIYMIKLGYQIYM